MPGPDVTLVKRGLRIASLKNAGGAHVRGFTYEILLVAGKVTHAFRDTPTLDQQGYPYLLWSRATWSHALIC